MKVSSRGLATAVIAVMVSSLLGTTPAAAAAEQVVEGSILLPATAVDPASPPNLACIAGAHRRAALLFNNSANGFVGYHFDVDPGTHGGTFVLEAVTAADFDLTFYSDFGAVPNTNPAETLAFQTRGNAGETGEIPAMATKVIICLFQGADAEFKYTGTAKGGAPKPGPSGSPSASPTSGPGPQPSPQPSPTSSPAPEPSPSPTGGPEQLDPGASLKVSDRTPARNAKITATASLGSCGTGHSGTKIDLQRKSAAGFTTVATKLLDANCRAKFSVQAKFKTAVFRSFWTTQDTDHRSAASKPVTVKTH